MHGRHARPVENALRDPVIACGVALRILTGGDLRHLHDDFQTGAPRGIRKICRSLNESGTHRVAKVCARHARGGANQVVMLEQIAHDDFGARSTKRCTTLVFRANHRADGMPCLEKVVDRMNTGFASGTGDQEFALLHDEASNR
jgi:hypothetical protein